MTPSAAFQIKFLQDLQRILQEGSFTATYKYALLLALADLSVELGDDSGRPLFVPIDAIAEKFIKYYWRQSRPYQSARDAEQILLQNTGQQASIVTYVRRHQHTTLAEITRDRAAWKRLVAATRRTILDQPLWKLQLVGGEVLPVLYEHTESRLGVELKPGVAFCLRRFHVMVYDLVTAAWVRFVRQLPANGPTLGHTTGLSEFLFGTERASLARFRPILEDVQRGRCFYCSNPLAHGADVDHFIPWSRYSVDLGHNFVLTHAGCNRDKRERLAALPHLERWVERNHRFGGLLAERFDDEGIAHDLGASCRVARWAYQQAAAAGALVWDSRDRLTQLPRAWRALLGSC